MLDAMDDEILTAQGAGPSDIDSVLSEYSGLSTR